MSQSLVPSIKMSRGNNRKTKFNISANAHTTAEVGYLQPIYSKILLPKSDLRLKVNDFIRMSSLIVPTFGKLDLRHWFNCTPLSSLWACYGSFMAQSQYNDLDSESGASIRTTMPKISMNELMGWLVASYASRVSGSNTSCAPFNGNITYLRKLVNSSRGDIMSFDDDFIQNTLLSQSVSSSENAHVKLMYHMCGYEQMENEAGLVIDRPLYQDEVVNTYEYRTRVPVPYMYNGFVVKNTENFMKHVKASDGSTTFPTPNECPYILVRVREIGSGLYDFASRFLGTQTTSLTASHYDGCLEYFPFTMKMFQGDTSLKLYINGWKSSIKKASDTAFYHPNGKAVDWVLGSDDAYFTGDLDNSKFDVSGNIYQTYYGNKTLKCGYSVNWSRRFQRLRKLFVGLGYQFNPFDTQPQTMWKILHYYKAWFDMFYPKRDTQYYQTPLSRFVNFISYHGKVCCDSMLDEISKMSGEWFDLRAKDDFIDMLMACADAKYLMPIDYYSLADPNPTEVEGTKNEHISDNVYVSPNGYHNPYELGDGVQSYNSTVRDGVEINLDPNNKAVINGNTITIAEKFTQFLVKKRIVGKSISDRMRAIYGAVDPHDKSHESTWCFGTSSTDINISAVMSQSETEEMHLGDYAGTGIGGGTSRTFSVDGNDADMYIVTIMSAIVPKLSYYQGHSRENMVGNSPLDFVTPLWDGVGYEDVSASEYIADICDTPVYQTQGSSNIHRSMAEINGKTIGLVPRGTWYKVNPHDILNGDMSRPSVMDSLNPYVLTRDVDPDFGISPIDMRTVDPDGFNKIFNESSSLDDHFIIQAQVEAEMYAPLKSISTSYDTFDNDEDGTIDVSHS